MKKKCYKCKLEKELDEFNKDRNGKYGLSSKCKLCSSETFKEYFNSHKDDIYMHCKEYVVCEDCFGKYKRYNKTAHLGTHKHIINKEKIEKMNLIKGFIN